MPPLSVAVQLLRVVGTRCIVAGAIYLSLGETSSNCLILLCFRQVVAHGGGLLRHVTITV